MYKVVIIDDELLVRKRIRYGFDWNALGYEIAGEASNGQAAVELLKQVDPDLAIVDVMMPMMNGIELAEYVKANGIKTRLVLLSAHSEFSYAQKAIQFGVKAYVLKPINEAVFVSILNDVREELNRDILETAQLQQMVRQNTEANELLKAKSLTDYFCGNGSAVCLSEYGLSPDEACDIYILYFMESNFDMAQLISLQSELTAKPFVRDRFEGAPVCFYDIHNDFFVMVARHAVGRDTEAFPQTLIAYMQENGFPSVLCGYSCQGRAPDSTAYKEASEALHATRYFDHPQPLDYERIRLQIRPYCMDSATLQTLQAAVGQDNMDCVQSMLKGIFAEIARAFAPYHDLTLACRAMLHALSVNGDANPIFNALGVYNDLESLMKSVWNISELSDWFCHFALESMDLKHHQALNNRKCIAIAERAKRIIEEGYPSSGFSIASIADQLGVSKPYMSGAFKEANGMTAVQYLSIVRLKHARSLLLTTSKSIREVAEESGFNDEYYFSKCFRKYYGFPPGKSRV